MAFKVTIAGRDLSTAARLMEALTSAGLLTSDIVWEDRPDKIILIIKDDGAMNRQQIFEKKRFSCISGGD